MITDDLSILIQAMTCNVDTRGLGDVSSLCKAPRVIRHYDESSMLLPAGKSLAGG